MRPFSRRTVTPSDGVNELIPMKELSFDSFLLAALLKTWASTSSLKVDRAVLINGSSFFDAIVFLDANFPCEFFVDEIGGSLIPASGTCRLVPV